MIALLTGNIASCALNGEIVIDVNGVGYKALLPEKESATIKTGDFASLHISTQVREDLVFSNLLLETSLKNLSVFLVSVEKWA